MNGSVSYEGAILSGNISINTEAQLEELTADHNGVYLPSQGKDGFSKVTVDVPDPVLDDITITENGHYTPPAGIDGYNDIVVSVPHPAPVLDDITITENGSYQPPTGVDGYDNINVNVLPTLDNISITANGTYQPPSGVDGYNNINVNVPAPSNAIFKQTLSNLPSPIATFTGADAPLDSLKASIVGVQSGSGDPSPSNIRPISGWSSCVVNRTGKNMLNETAGVAGFFKSDGSIQSSQAWKYQYIKVNPNTNYTISNIPAPVPAVYLCWFDVNKKFISNSGSHDNVTITSPNNALYLGFCVNQNSELGARIQIEAGNQATTYEPYNGNTYTILFKDSSDNPITVYGGGIDISGGKLTVTHANIASYNGETINDPWISSEDIYTQGATPTTGAQVVYPLTTPLVYDFDPLALRCNGVTNISVNCGAVTECKYYSETP